MAQRNVRSGEAKPVGTGQNLISLLSRAGLLFRYRRSNGSKQIVSEVCRDIFSGQDAGKGTRWCGLDALWQGRTGFGHVSFFALLKIAMFANLSYETYYPSIRYYY